MKKLNLGCGKDIRKDYINLDRAKLPGVNVVWDINKLPLPFKANQFDEILCRDVLEHVDYIPLLKDLHRILKKGGKIIIRVPHFSSKNLYADPTHRCGFSRETFDYFKKNHEREYYFDFNFSKCYTKIEFDKKWYLPWNFIFEIILNLNWRLLAIYELTPLRIFPADTLKVKLIK
jgi:predicted SAM-dependent methyltransferase